MFIELIDLLRCPVEHEESWLVAAFTKMEGRFVLEGKLGCPVCLAGYPITGGIANLSESDSMVPRHREETGDSDDALRYAAMLGLTRPGSLVAMEGDAALHAEALAALTECRVVAINPPGHRGEHERVGVVLSTEKIPLAQESVDGVVLSDATDSRIAAAARVTRPGGRIVAPSAARFDARFRELARDDRHVVAELVGQLVTLSR